LEEPALSSTEINIETFKGTSIKRLREFPPRIDKAVAVARGGMKSVKNDMQLK
jgi:hypothetical protein